MCRLFAFNGNQKTDDYINALERFSELSEYGCVPCGIEGGHMDGWGIHSSNEREGIYYRSINHATKEDVVDSVKNLSESQGQTVAHLRKASVGNKYLGNTHPFMRSGISFCHNGSIHAFPETDFVSDRYLREGHTDSETFFLRILDRVEGQAGDASLENLKKALVEEVEEIKKTSDWTSLTCLLKSKDGIILNYLWNEESPDKEQYEYEKYYTFYVGKKDNETILCSEKLDLDGFEWEKLKNDTILVLAH